MEWIKRFIGFHRERHQSDMREHEISHLIFHPASIT